MSKRDLPPKPPRKHPGETPEEREARHAYYRAKREQERRLRRIEDWKRRLPILAVAVVLVAVVGVLVMQAVTRNEKATEVEPSDAMASMRAEAEAEAEAALREAVERRAQVRLPPGRPLRVGFIGDSITVGSYTASVDQRWASLVADWLDGQHPTEYSVVAESGRSTAQALSQQVPEDADLVFVMLGNNDLERPEAFADSYARLIGKVERASPAAQIVCVDPYLDTRLPGVTSILSAIEQICRDPDIETTVSLGSIPGSDGLRAKTGDLLSNGYEVPDDGHPNADGHAAIAERVIDMLAVTTG